MEELLVALVEAPTTLGHEEAGQALMEEALRDGGLAPESVALDAEALRAHPQSSPFSWDVAGKRNVVATFGGAAPDRGRSLVLNGHVDVVPPAATALWSSPPFAARRDGDWLYGRGAGDMKAGLVAIAGAVRAIARAGLEPAAPVYVESVVEEECTGNGALQCRISRPSADACVITEPHFDHVTTAQVGVLWFAVHAGGTPAHAARASALGVNAIDAMGSITAALRELEAELNADPPAPYDRFEHPLNLNPGTIAGGDWTSTVAAACTATYRLATYPGHPVAELRARVEETIARAAAAHPFLVDHPPRVTYDGFACDGIEVDHGEPIVAALRAAHGSELPLLPTTATTDARHFVQHGIPAVCFGPHAERIHGIDERVSLHSMVRTAQTLATLIRDWSGLVALPATSDPT